jgi:hypothetical protein
MKIIRSGSAAALPDSMRFRSVRQSGPRPPGFTAQMPFLEGQLLPRPKTHFFP